MEDNQNKLIIDPLFYPSIEELSKKEFDLHTSPDLMSLYSPDIYELQGNLSFNELKAYDLDVKKGSELFKSYRIGAYDESINKYQALSGSAFIISHSYIYVGESDYIPVVYINFLFLTKSKEMTNTNCNLIFSENIEYDSRILIHNQMIDFLIERVPENSILLVDGPIFTGSLETKTVEFNERLLKKNIIPIFFVKNSISNLICNNILELKNRFNSDLHWSYKFLKNGQRTNFFLYEEPKSKKRAKAFCYMKIFNLSPVRIEIYRDFYLANTKLVEDLMNLVFYLYIVQGNYKNPQSRPVAIAEMFARAGINLFNLEKLLKELGIMGSMNQNRNMVNF